MYNKLPVKERIELMKSYRKANKDMSYRDMVKDYNDSYEKFQDGGKKSFNDWYKTVPSNKADTSSYNLRRAYELAPQKDLDNFVKDPNAHLYSTYENKETGIYEFMKSKNHPTIQKELEWFNSNNPEAIKFRKNYKLDTSKDYYQYVPQQHKYGGVQQFGDGGYKSEAEYKAHLLDPYSLEKRTAQIAWLNNNKPLPYSQRVNYEPASDNDSWLENAGEIIDPTGISSWDDIHRAYKNKGIGKETALESLGSIPLLGKVSKVTKPGIHLTKYTGLDAILKNTLPKNKSLSRAANVTSKVGRGTDAVQAALGAKDDSSFTWDIRHGETPKYGGRNIFPQIDLGETGDFKYGGIQKFGDGGKKDNTNVIINNGVPVKSINTIRQEQLKEINNNQTKYQQTVKNPNIIDTYESSWIPMNYNRNFPGKGRDTTIDLTKNDLSFGRVGEVVKGNNILGGDFIWDDPTAYYAIDYKKHPEKFKNPGHPLGLDNTTKDYYGVENKKLKIGKINDFNDSTVVVPSAHNVSYKKANVTEQKQTSQESGFFQPDIVKRFNLQDSEGKNIKLGLNANTKAILHSPKTGAQEFVYADNPYSLMLKLNTFKSKNPDAMLLQIDNGRYHNYLTNKKGLTKEDFENYAKVDLKNIKGAGYNLIATPKNKK